MIIRATKPKLIVLDADVPTLQQISQAAREFYQVVPTRDSRWAMAWLAQYRDVSIFIASEPLAGDDLALFRKARIMRPDVLRVLLTPNMDQPQLGQAVELETVNHLLQMPFGEESLLDLICPEAAGISVTPQRLLA